MKKSRKYILAIVIAALSIKLFLFAYMLTFAPDAKFQPDSPDYINTGIMLVSQGVFAQDYNGALVYELRRTPGYPLFLGILHGIMKIPLEGVIFLQLLLTMLAAFITYKAAFEIDKRIAFLSGAIVLFDLPTAMFSLQILTEALYLFLISLFMFFGIRYLEKRKLQLVILLAILLAAATYVRPISYYLGAIVAIFILFTSMRDKFKKAIFHTLVFLLVAYGLLGIWQLRNYIHFKQNIFTNFQINYKIYSLLHSYAANKDPSYAGLNPIIYYINIASRSFLTLMTGPGSLKYLHCYTLSVMGKIFGYTFVAFWWIGFLIGLSKVKSSIYYRFILFIILFFVFFTVTGLSYEITERYRIPIMPFIAIISAAGWIKLKHAFLKTRT